MRRLVRLAARLYPSWWRQRYAREFEALLEDTRPGWSDLFDVLSGAFTMQIRTVATIPVACALAGLAVGAVVAMLTPEVFTSSATVRINAETPEILASVEKALGGWSGVRTHASVTLGPASAPTMLRITYDDRDPAEAQRIAEQLTTAIASTTSAEIIGSPVVPTSPTSPSYPMTLASGGIVGLVAGGVAVLLPGLRRRRPGRAV